MISRRISGVSAIRSSASFTRVSPRRPQDGSGESGIPLSDCLVFRIAVAAGKSLGWRESHGAGADMTPRQTIGDGTVAASSMILGMPGARTSRRVGRGRILFLASLPVTDSILDQINTAYHPAIGQLSLLQVLRGGLIVVIFITLALTRGRTWRPSF